MTSLNDAVNKISLFISKITDFSGLEIEAKISKIDESDFLLLQSLFSSKFKKVESFTIDYYSGDKRITESGNNYTNTSKQSLLREYLNIDDRTIKFSIAREKLETSSKDETETFDFKREKERSSFVDGNLRLDLTKISKNREITYEFEIEVIDPTKFKDREFMEKVNYYFNLVSNYSEEIYKFCNQKLSNDKLDSEKGILYGLISRPRDLKKEDLTRPKAILSGFTVSVKASGVQYFLLFHKFGIWLLSSKGEKIRVSDLTDDLKSLENSIFAGEYIFREQLVKKTGIDSIGLFLPFDTICYQNRSVVDLPYLERISYFDNIVDTEIISQGIKKIKIIRKNIYDLGETSKSFYQGFKKCYQEKSKLIYEEDGYVFTPKFSSYVAEGQTKSPRDRVLFKYLDVCKFKPVEKRSIDFLVSNGKLYTYDGRKTVPFDSLKYDLDFQDDIEDKIVEFFPDFSGEEIILKPKIIREDKQMPNKPDVAELHVMSYTEPNPITEKTLLGEDTVLMRNFNNFYIKGELIRNINGYVIDMGAGKGGDMTKFGKNREIEKVISVEPNKEFNKEYKKRLSTSRFKDKFYLLENTKAEQYEPIIEAMKTFFPKNFGSSKLTITFMISLSFFWSSEENLNKLVVSLRSIEKQYRLMGGKKNVEIVFYTIDGYKVEKFFSEQKKKSVNLNTITLKLTGKNQVFIDIKDSKTVDNQIEYLVKLDQLYKLSDTKDVFLKQPRVVNILMTESEKTYLSLFSYGKGYMLPNSKQYVKFERLPVDTNQGIESEGIIYASGDDELSSVYFLDNKIRRISCIDMGMSLHHSLLKLLDEEYREAGFDERISMVEKLRDNVTDLESASKYFKIGIKIFTEKEINIVNGKKEYVLLLLHQDKTFEPLVYIEKDIVSYTFGKDSYLIN